VAAQLQQLFQTEMRHSSYCTSLPIEGKFTQRLVVMMSFNLSISNRGKLLSVSLTMPTTNFDDEFDPSAIF
jgi:hypothetical protein